MTGLAAIDFETANGQRSSVCSVGVVVVRGGVITDTFYSLIHPEPDYYTWFCQEVHGLSHEDTDNAPCSPSCGDRSSRSSPDCPSWRTTVLLTRAASRPCSASIRWTIPTTSSFAPARLRGVISDGGCPTTSYTPWPRPAAAR